MAAGNELKLFQANLTTTTNQMEIVKQDIVKLGDALDDAATAASSYLNFRKVIKVLDAGFAAALTSLKLTENVAPLSTPSKALKDVLQVIQPRIADIKDVTDKAKKLEPLLEKFVKAERVFENTVTPAVIGTDETLDNILSGIDEFVDAFDRVSTPNGIPEINPNAGTERPGKDAFTGLFAEADGYVAFANGPNGAAQEVFAAYNTSKDLLNELAELFDVVDFSNLNEIFGDLAEFEDLFAGLEAVLEVVSSVLRPIEPLLDAVGAVFDLVVQPVIDFLKDELGIDELFDALSAQLEPLFPEVTLFDGFLDVSVRLEGMLDQLDVDFFEIPDFTDISLDVFDRFDGTLETIELAALSLIDGIPLRIGDPDGDKMLGTGGDEAFDPQNGDDEVFANDGNDIIVASGGADTIDGGDGIDRLVFAGELAEYDFTRENFSTDPGAEIILIFTHTDVGAHGFNEGTEVVTNIEYFDFGTETFTKEQFERAIVGTSVLDGDGPVGEATTDEGELIFLNKGGTLIDGLTLNGKTFDGMNVVYGLGGDDRIQGTVKSDAPGSTDGKDFIFGGPGNDLLIPRTGEDALDGGPGIDTFQIFNLGFNTADRIDLAKGTAFVRGGATELANVENVIVQQNGDTQLRGDDAGNVLFTGSGRDMITGRGGNDALFGNDGRDVLWGGQGVDTLRGGDDNDFLGALNTSDNGGSETYDGEAGFDTLSYATGRDEINKFLSNNVFYTGMLNEAMSDSATTGPVVIRTKEGQVDRLDGDGTVIATDIALNIETYVGSDSNDVIYGSGDSLNRIEIKGGGGDDTLYSWGANEVQGGRGNDLLIAQRSPDGGRIAGYFEGDSGTDTLDLRPVGDAKFVIRSDTSGRVNVTVADKDDTGRSQDARGARFNVDGVEEFLLGENDDYVEWGTGNDAVIRGAGGNDFLRSVSSDGTQSPTFFGDEGDDTIILDNGGSAFGGVGDDRIEVASSSEQEVQGNEGNDTFLIERMDGSLAGGEGYDTLILDPLISSGVTVNLTDGTAFSQPGNRNAASLDLTNITGVEALITSDNADDVTGSADADRISLRGGNDMAKGGDGNDQLVGGSGNDTLLGEGDNDTINGGTGNDSIDGGAGTDTVEYSFAAPDGPEGGAVATSFQAAVVDLSENTGGRGSERDTLNNVENVIGTHLNDQITGDGAGNVLLGGAGADTLNGGDGNDILIAGGGGLSIVDVMNGDGGNDSFVIGSGSFVVDGGAGNDTLDFSGGTDPAQGGGRSLGVIIDLKRGLFQRDVEQSVVVWADDGTQSARSFDGQVITPQDVLLSDPFYALSAADLNLRLPTGEEDDPNIPSFAIDIATSVNGDPTEIRTFESIESLVGSSQKDFLTGDAQANTLSGSNGDDVLRGREGDDILNGGEGRDAAYFDGDQARYTLSVGPDGTTITDRTGVNGTDTLTSIEILDFEFDSFEGGFKLDQFGGLGGLAADALESFIELYIAYFNRAPDAVGLNFWGTAFANGTTLEQSASLFIDQDETRATYPSDLSNADFATAVYNNVLGRVPDQTGFDFWVGVLNDGSVGRDQFILAILGGAKANPPGGATPEFIAQQLADQKYLADKTDIGTFFAVNKGMSDVENAIAVMQLFDGTQTSIEEAIALTEAYFAEAGTAEGGEFLMPIVGILDDPFV
ncbi:MAG: DUF4214 domain-containing protein [Sulfitobacter sp.]